MIGIAPTLSDYLNALCRHFGQYHRLFPRRFTKTLRPGALLSIVVEGDVGAGGQHVCFRSRGCLRPLNGGPVRRTLFPTLSFRRETP